jgi:hypothetical protein
MSLIKEQDALCVLHLWHKLFKELLFVLDAAAVDLIERFLCSAAKGASELGFANAALAVEHEEWKNCRVLVSIKIKAELTLDVILSDDVFECLVHGGGGSLLRLIL